MGAADVVPGVSGGTIAFISGIYQRLLGAISAIDPVAVRLLVSLRLRQLWQHIDGTFLTVLIGGISISIIALSQLILYLLTNYPEMLWAFFFGLVLASALPIGRSIQRWNGITVLTFLFGTGIAYWITVAVPVETPTELWFIFLSGAIAICAMILPGISGSFMLLLMSKYEYIITAVAQLNLKVLTVFALGCTVGLLSFSKFLRWLLKHYHDGTVALLMGFMIGSLNKVWPWKKVLQYYSDRHGKLKPLLETNVLPTDYLELTGKEPMLVSCILLCLLGFGLVYFLERLAASKTT